MKKIIIDSSALAHRVKYTLQELNTEFLDTGVIFGFMKKMLEIAKTFETNQFLFAFDSRHSKRKEIYPEYKAKRKEDIPEEVEILNKKCYKQLLQLRTQILPYIGFKNIFQIKGYEADDIIALLVKKYPDDYIVYSGDADLYQLLDHCSIYKPNRSLYTKEEFENEYGITPKQWVMVKAYAGCSSDNVIGVKGIGEKRAIAYIKKEASKTIKENIEKNMELVEKNKHVVRLPMKNLKKVIPKNGEKLSLGNFINICDRFNFRSFLDDGQLAKWTAYFEME